MNYEYDYLKYSILIIIIKTKITVHDKLKQPDVSSLL